MGTGEQPDLASSLARKIPQSPAVPSCPGWVPRSLKPASPSSCHSPAPTSPQSPSPARDPGDSSPRPGHCRSQRHKPTAPGPRLGPSHSPGCSPPRPSCPPGRSGGRPGPEGQGHGAHPGSGLPQDHTTQVQLALSGHDGLPVLQVVGNEVADALEQHVLCPHLQDQRPGIGAQGLVQEASPCPVQAC